MPPLPPRTDVLVVGAGPAGLAAALSLHKNGCTDITVVDCAHASDSTSRAVATHAATLEVSADTILLCELWSQQLRRPSTKSHREVVTK